MHSFSVYRCVTETERAIQPGPVEVTQYEALNRDSHIQGSLPARQLVAVKQGMADEGGVHDSRCPFGPHECP